MRDGDEDTKAAREAAEDESGCHGADGSGGSPAAERGSGGGLQLHLRSVCAAVLFGQRGWRSTRKCCSGCCWQGICTGSSPRGGWRKRSTPTSRTSGSAGWIEQTRRRMRRWIWTGRRLGRSPSTGTGRITGAAEWPGGCRARRTRRAASRAGRESRKAFITANTGRWTAGATSTSTSNLPTSTTSFRFLKSPTKSRCGWESCRSPWDWTRDATAQESPICWKRRESRASSAAGGTPIGRIAMANAASDAPLLRRLHLPGSEASLLEDRHPRWECQYSATAKPVKPVRDGQRALERVWREGGWRDMSGRMLRTKSLP